MSEGRGVLTGLIGGAAMSERCGAPNSHALAHRYITKRQMFHEMGRSVWPATGKELRWAGYIVSW